MILNSKQCHFMCTGKDTVSDFLQFELESGFGLQIDHQLKLKIIIKLSAAKPPKNQELCKKSRTFCISKRKIFYLICSVQLLPTCLDVLLDKIRFFGE